MKKSRDERGQVGSHSYIQKGTGVLIHWTFSPQPVERQTLLGGSVAPFKSCRTCFPFCCIWVSPAFSETHFVELSVNSLWFAARAIAAS